jgi:hypothetical protein
MSMTNPFDAAADTDRHAIWQMLVARDSEAFVAQDWSMVENDFDEASFEGVRCFNSANPDEWRIVFPRLEDYRDAWLAAAKDFAPKKFADVSPLEALLSRCRLEQIDIAGEIALAHKKFSGVVTTVSGAPLSGERQTLYRLRRRDGQWKIVGFLGFLPLQ